jgi:hypothetical protein
MNSVLKAAVAAVCLAWAAPVVAQETPAAPLKDDAAKQAKQEDSERQLLVGMFAVWDYCKESLPDRAKDLDASWTKNTADVPAPLIEFSKTPNFTGMVEERVKSFRTGSSNPEYAARLKASCEKMLQ